MFVIVNVDTKKLYYKSGHYCSAMYETERGAKAACTRLNRAFTGCEMKVSNGKDVVQWTVMSASEYRARPVKMVKKINLMSGQEYTEAEDTPLCCSPASETYWST